MFNSIALQVCIGLIFIYLLYSLLATILQEIFARWMGLRARILLKGLRRMLEDGATSHRLTVWAYFHDLLQGIAYYFRPMKDKTFLKAFYDYPLVKYLGENNWQSKPAYLRPENFSDTIIHLLRGQGFNNTTSQMALIQNNLATNQFSGFTINPETLKYVKQLWVDAGNDIDKFKTNLEGWFNSTMERTTGWYKRRTQLMLLLIGMGLAIGFNVDSIAIYKILAHNDKAREQLVQLAVTRYGEYGKIIDTLKSLKERGDTSQQGNIRALQSNLDTSLNGLSRSIQEDAAAAQDILGLGHCKDSVDSVCQKRAVAWLDSVCKSRKLVNKDWDDFDRLRKSCNGCKSNMTYQSGSKVVVFIGWLLTALAVSLGAPFWFDLLNKIMALRSAGVKPPGATRDKDAGKSNNPNPLSINRVG